MSERGTEGKTEAEAGGMEGQKGGRVCVCDLVFNRDVESIVENEKREKES